MKRILALILSLSLTMSYFAPAAYALTAETSSVESVIVETTENVETDSAAEADTAENTEEETPDTDILQEETVTEAVSAAAQNTSAETTENITAVNITTESEYAEVDMEIRYTLNGVEEVYDINSEDAGSVTVLQGANFDIFAYDRLTASYVPITHVVAILEDGITATCYGELAANLDVSETAEACEVEFIFTAAGRQYYLPVKVERFEPQWATWTNEDTGDGGDFVEGGTIPADSTVRFDLSDYWGYPVPVGRITITTEETIKTWISGDNGYIYIPDGISTKEIAGYVTAGGIDHYFNFVIGEKELTGTPMGNGLYWFVEYGCLNIFYSDKDGEGTGVMDDDLMGADDEWYDNRGWIYSIKLHPGVKTVDNNAFSSLNKVSEVDLGTVEEIWAGAFSGMSELTEITLPETLKRLGSDNFSGTAITTITIPASVETIDPGAFDGMSKLQEVIVDAGNAIYKTDGTSVYEKYTWGDGGYELTAIRPVEDLYLPDEVTQIHGHVIAFAETVKNVSVSDTNEAYKSVDGVLYSKDGKTLVWYPAAKQDTTYTVLDGTETLKGWCFAQTGFQTTGLEEIILPTSITSLSTATFSNNKTLKTIRYQGSKAAWDKNVEVGSSGYSYTIYDKYTVVYEGQDISGKIGDLDWTVSGDSIFISGTGDMPSYNTYDAYPWYEYKDSIKKVVIEEGVTSVGDYAFYGYGITGLTLPDGMKKIGNGAFSDYFATSISLPDSIEYIGEWAFAFAHELTDGNVWLPANLEYIHPTAFGSGSGVTSLLIDGNNETYHSRNGTIYTYRQNEYGGEEDVLYMYPSGRGGLVQINASVIGEFAFWGSYIDVVEINHVTEIEPYAFCVAENLREITLNSTEFTVGDGAFVGAVSLSKVNYPGEEWEWEEFVTVGADNDALLNAEFNYNCNRIGGDLNDETYWEYDRDSNWLRIKGDGAMPDYTSGEEKPWDEYKDEIEQIYIQDNVTHIGDYAFENMPNVWYVRIDCQPTIGKYAFNGLELDHFRIPNYLTTVTSYAFAGMKARILNFPLSVTNLNTYAFLDAEFDFVKYEGTITDWFKIIKSDGNEDLTAGDTTLLYENSTVVKGTVKAGANVEWEFDLNENKLTLTGYGDTYDYSESDPAPFAYLADSICTVRVDSSIYSLGDYLFHELDNMYCLYLMNSTVQIGNNVFDNCMQLGELYFAGDRTALDNLTIGENNGYFDPDNMMIEYNHSDFIGGDIGEGVFWNYNKGDKTLWIGTDIAWEDPYWDIPEYEDYYYPWTEFQAEVEHLHLDGAIRCVPARAFEDFRKLEDVTIYAGVAALGDYVFSGCTNLKTVTISKKYSEMTSIGNFAFASCTSLESITLPDNLKSIGTCAFLATGNLKNITIPDKVTAIAQTAFQSSGIEWIYIPTSVKTINHSAFFRCGNLSVVYYGGTEKQWKSVKIAEGNDTLKNAAVVCSAVPGKYSAIAVKYLEGGTVPATVYVDLMPYTTQSFDFIAEAVGMGVSSTNVYAYTDTSGVVEVIDNGNGVISVVAAGRGEAKVIFGCNEDDSIKKEITFKVSKVAEAAELTLKGMTADEHGNYKTTVGAKLTPVITWIGGDPWNEYEIGIPENSMGVLGFDASGNIVATGAGRAEIILVCGKEGSDQMYSSVWVEVFAEKVKGIQASSGKVILDPTAGWTAQEIWFWPTNDACGEFEFTWTENPVIKVVPQGSNSVYVEAVSSEKATVTITAKALDGSGKTAKVTVQTGVVVRDIHSTGSLSQTLAVGRTMKINLTVAPADATVKTLEWLAVVPDTDEPTDVVTVKNGTVKAVKPGRATIFARAMDGSGYTWGMDIEVTNPAKTVVIGDGSKAITVASHEDGQPIRLPVTVLGTDGTTDGTTDGVVQELDFAYKSSTGDYSCEFDHETNELVIYPSTGKGTVTLTTTDGTNIKGILNINYEVHMLSYGFAVDAPKGTAISWNDEACCTEWTVKEGATVKPVVTYNWGEKYLAMPKAMQKYEIEVVEATDPAGIVVDNSKGTFKAAKPGNYVVTFKYAGGCDECAPTEDITVAVEVLAKTAVNIKDPTIVFPETIQSWYFTNSGRLVELAAGSQVQLSAMVSGQKPSGVNVEWKAYEFDVDSWEVGEEVNNIISKTGKLNLKNSIEGDVYYIVLTVSDKNDNSNSMFYYVNVTQKPVAAEITLVNMETGEDIKATQHKPSTEAESFVLAGIDGTAGVYEVKSASPKVATVEEKFDYNTGDRYYEVTYVGAGTANINVTAKDGSNVKATIKVKVDKHTIPVSAITVPVKAVTVNGGQQIALNYAVKGNVKTGEDASNTAVLWTLDKNANFVENDDRALLTYNAEGELLIQTHGATGNVTLTGKAMDGSNKTVKVTVSVVDWNSGKAVERMEITLPANTANDGVAGEAVLTWGKALALKLNMVPPKADSKAVVWEVYCLNEETGDWDADMAKAAGITVKAGRVTVPKPTAKTTPYTGIIRVVAKLPYQVNGWVEGVGDVLTNMETAVEIRVKAPIDKLTITGAPKTAYAGEIIQLEADKVISTLAGDAEYPMLWSVSDRKLAEIDENGCLTIKENAAAGKTVKVTVQTMDGTNKKATVSIKIS